MSNREGDREDKRGKAEIQAVVKRVQDSRVREAERRALHEEHKGGLECGMR